MNRRAVTRRLRCEEHGVVLVMVAMLMTVFIASAALAIDLGSLDGAQRQAQAAADAGALAGAAALPSPASASATATTFAKTNYPTGTPTVSVSGNQVTVSVSANPPNFFGKAFPVSASAVAGTTAGGSTPCTTAGSTCMAIFAMDTSCSSSPISFGGGGNHIYGGVSSNGSVSPGSNDFYYGTNTYGNGPGCTWPTQDSNYPNSNYPAAQAAATSYPVDFFAKDFPFCNGSSCTGACDVSTIPCPAASQTPSFCTQASTQSPWQLYTWATPGLTTGQIYCAVGNGPNVLAYKPSTWNGAISAAAQTLISSSFVGGSISWNGGSTAQPCGYSSSGYTASACRASVPAPATTNYPVAAMTGTGTAIDGSAGGIVITGDEFAPYGTIKGGGGNTSGFLEAFDVVGGGGDSTLYGDGPTGSAGSSSSGTVALLR